MPKCSECGFLALRTPENQILEATRRTRTSGEYIGPNGDRRTASGLFCKGESVALSTDQIHRANQAETIVKVIGNERDCRRFVPYSEGKSPKEHEERVMLDKCEAAIQRRHDESEAVTQRRHRETVRVMWFGIAGAVLAGVMSGLLSGILSSLLLR